MSGAKSEGAGGLQLKLGLINVAGKYLTAETFGFKINASSTTFRKKQLWVIEPDASEQDVVHVRSHLGRYLSGDKKGNVTCEKETPCNDEKFIVQYHPDGSGRWAFQNRVTGYYFGGSDDKLRCYEKTPTDSEWWWIHLAIHPQVNLRHPGRQKYVRLSADGAHLQATELIPWGREAIIELEFREGRYCVKSCDGRFLTSSGSLSTSPTDDALFTFEMKTVGSLSGMALRDSAGKYLTAVGSNATVQGRQRTVGKDELFVAEDSQAQVFFTAHNNKIVSIRQGLDVSANQDPSEWSDKETFQIEADSRKPNQWRVRTSINKNWSVESASGIQAVGSGNSPNELFALEYQSDGTVALRASNGRYVTARMNGSLYAVSEAAGERELFSMLIINRPVLVLRCEYGFVGLKTAANPRYECNKASYDVIFVEAHGNTYSLKGNNGSYVFVADDGGLVASSREPQSFILELQGNNKLAIKAPNGSYVRGEQNGIMTASVADVAKATLWEF